LSLFEHTILSQRQFRKFGGFAQETLSTHVKDDSVSQVAVVGSEEERQPNNVVGCKTTNSDFFYSKTAQKNSAHVEFFC